MSLDRLVERIMRDARENADRINKDALQKRARHLDQAEIEAERAHDRIMTRARKESGEKKRQLVTMATLEARKTLLAEKQLLIQEAFERALYAVTKLPEEEYVELLVRWLIATGKVEGALIMSPADRDRVGTRIVSKAGEELGRGGKSATFTLSPETREMSGGFALRSEGIEINNSLEALEHARRDDLEFRVVEILFGNEGPDEIETDRI